MPKSLKILFKIKELIEANIDLIPSRYESHFVMTGQYVTRRICCGNI